MKRVVCRVVHLRKSRDSGFTLIELLVGMVVATLLVVVLFQIFNVASNAWQRGETRVDAFREARGALTTMSRDFSYAIPEFPQNPLKVTIAAGSTTPPASSGNPVFVLDGYTNKDIGQDTFDRYNEQAYFLTVVPSEGVVSLCAVGYFCAWMPDVAASASAKTRAPHAFALYRQFLSGGGNGSGTTGSTTALKPGLYERLATVSAKSQLEFLDIFERLAPPAASASTPPKAVATELASYIWDLQFRIDTNLTASRGSAQPPTDHSDKFGAGPARPYAASGGLYPTMLPRFVEVRFKALSTGAARQIEGNGSITKQDWADQSTDPASNYYRFIRPSVQQFVMRVPLLNSRPLP